MLSSKQNLFQRLQVGDNILIIVLCMCVCIPLGYVQRFFNSSCILNAAIFGSLTSKDSNGTSMLIVDSETTRMGDAHLCEYTTYVPVVVAMHAFIWSWFFICVRRSLKEDGHETCFLLPVLLLHGILFICMLVSSWIVTSGFTSWCHSVETNVDHSSISCKQSQDVVWSIYIDTHTHKIYALLLLAQICSWLVTACLLGQCIIGGVLAYIDLHAEPDEQKRGILVETSNDGYTDDANVHRTPIHDFTPTSSIISEAVVHRESSY